MSSPKPRSSKLYKDRIVKDVDEEGLLLGESGVVYTEFIIAFIPVFVMFLCMVQLSLMYVANLATEHAATTAVRAAVVVLPDNPRRYDDDPQNQISYDGAGIGSAIMDLLGSLGLSGDSPPSSEGDGSSRLRAIRSAASLPLLSVSPSLDSLISDSQLERAVGGSVGSRAATGVLLYNRAAVAVTFPDAPGSDSFRESFGPDDDVTTRVTYLFHCAVPLASMMMCDSYLALRTGIPVDEIVDLIGGGGFFDAVEAARRRRERLERQEVGMDELQKAEIPWLGWLTLLTGSRFTTMRAEATLRIQGADYEYQD